MVRALAILCVTIVGACGDGPTGPVAIEALQGELVAARCAFEAACELVIDEATCRAGWQLDDAGTETLIADVAVGIVAYDPAGAGACVDAVRARDCSSGDAASACDAYLVGTLAPGAPCFLDQECISQRCDQLGGCDPTTSCCPGSCAPPPAALGEVGAPCRNGPACATGYCVGASAAAAGVCTAPIAVEGAVCTDVFACASPMSCTGGGGVPGQCRRPAATGAPCETIRATPCADLRDYCDAATATCRRRGRVGEACAPAAPCAALADCFGGTCVAAVAVGLACDDLAGPACAGGGPGAGCVDGVCALGPSSASCR